MSLCLHAGANAIDRAALSLLPLPAARGARHVVRPFIEDVEMIDMFLRDEGYSIVEEAFGVRDDKNGMPADFFGVLTVDSKYSPAGTKDFALQIGIRGSYAQNIPRQMVAGQTIFCCDNMSFTGEIKIGTKQTTNVGQRMPILLREAVRRIPSFAQHQITRVDAYKGRSMTQRSGDATLVECVRRGIMPASNLPRALEYWDAPEHDEHLERGQRTAYTLYNSVTEALKQQSGKANVHQLVDRTVPLTAMFDEGVGLQMFQ